MQTTPLRVGIIGLGRMGRNHLRILSLLKGLDLRFVFDTDEQAAAQVAASAGVPAASDIDVALKEMVSTEQVESLLTGRIDIGLLRPPIGRSEFTTLKVAEERLVAALPVGDPRLAEVAAEHDAYVCLMHMQGEPRTMQDDPRYDDVASEVAAFLEDRLVFAVAQGVAEERICLDPGIGFGKTVEHNLELVRRLDVLLALGRPVLIGISRKSTLRRLGATDLVSASVAAAVAAYERGATILRVHDVAPHVDALSVAKAFA